ncbi:hypothetical protein R50072_38160 [Simiduia litorea]
MGALDIISGKGIISAVSTLVPLSVALWPDLSAIAFVVMTGEAFRSPTKVPVDRRVHVPKVGPPGFGFHR